MKNSTAPLFDYHNEVSTKRKYGRASHGGVASQGRRKEYRPLAERKWIHLTLKSAKAKGQWSFLSPKNRKIVRDTLKEKSKKWGVEIAEVVNMGNHLHIKLRFKYREGFQNFLRSVTAVIARKITNARRGYRIDGSRLQKSKTITHNPTLTAQKKARAFDPSRDREDPQPTEKFWQGLAFTRVLRTRIEELQLRGYFQANRVQATHGEKAREQFLARFNEWVLGIREVSRRVPSG